MEREVSVNFSDITEQRYKMNSESWEYSFFNRGILSLRHFLLFLIQNIEGSYQMLFTILTVILFHLFIVADSAGAWANHLQGNNFEQKHSKLLQGMGESIFWNKVSILFRKQLIQ